MHDLIFTGSVEHDVTPWVTRWEALGLQAPRHDGREGYLGDGVLGCRAGPHTRFENLAHEMAHAIEVLGSGQPSRLKKDSWGMTLNKVTVMNQTFDDPMTMQPTQRECRVAGIQRRILEMVEAPRQHGFTSRIAQALHDFMPDYHHGGPTAAARLQTRRRLIRKSYDAWPASRVMEQWAVVMATLSALKPVEVFCAVRRVAAPAVIKRRPRTA